MALALGTRIGVFEVTGSLGAGGMGEVYRAKDTKLGRDVALKILPDQFATDPDRLARFKREAYVLASLNHPHIGSIYGLEDSDGKHALVLELVEGETLADRIARSAIPSDEALSIASQVAEALEAAHKHGIIHRDLKPSNIKLRPDGTVKVLDFGLAKALETPNGANPLALPITSTEIGTVLGTTAYMSPEQAGGQVVDKRADIWAFGCVLYELLTRRIAFSGATRSDTLAAVLEREPDWGQLPARTPPVVRSLLRQCLRKQPAQRLHDARAARLALEDAIAAPESTTGSAVGPTTSHPSWSHLAALLAVALFVGGVVAWVLRPAVLRPVTRSTITLPEGDRFNAVESTRHLVAVSPDGSRIAYIANGRVYLRMRDQLTAVAITEGGTSPFFSPDGQWLGFWQDGQLKKVSINGGAAVALCAATFPLGASWGPDDTILYGQDPGGIWRVSAAGGTPENLVKLNAGQRAHGPQLLPGGHALLFTLAQGGDTWDDAQIVVQSLDGGARQVVVRGGTDARYLPTGHLVYARRGSLLAVPFDVERLEATGGPVPLVNDVAQSTGGFSGAAQFSVSGDGTLVYVPASSSPLTDTARLLWVDRTGREAPISAPPRVYIGPTISPDGGRVAYTTIQGTNVDIWIYEFRRGILERLTSDQGPDTDPVWSPDGRRIAYRSQPREGRPGIFVRAADGTGDVERLTTGTHAPSSWSPDGTRIFYSDFGSNAATPTAPADVGVLTLTPDRRAEKLLATPVRESQAVIAPDGRWLAYESSETGEKAIFVRPFPDSTARWPLSTAGGVSPVWARDGRTLFYRSGQAIMAVAVRGATPADWSAPEKLVEGPYFAEGLQMFDVAPDGRFLMLKAGGDAGTMTPDSLIVVQNWTEELKRLVPTK